MKSILNRVVLLLIGLMPLTTLAVVRYDQGQRFIKGIQLLQDYSDPTAYYYLPQFPRLATKADGALELLCLKYVDGSGKANGGLFHALVEFTLPPEVLAEVEKELKKEVAGSRIVGPVPLLQVAENGAEGVGSFQVVSAVLSDKAEGGFTRTLITSGKAPLAPGSKAVVAAILTQQGATLLWDSLTGSTSDVSVAIHAYYEAAVEGYNAKIFAEMSTVYEHFSRISNQQQDYTKRQLRKVIDDLQRKGTLKIEVFDRTASLGIKASDMEGILDIVTGKLTELMFDHTNGWAKDPEREAAVEANQIQGRQERGWFASVFGGTDDTKYYTDDQFVLKKRQDIRHNVFSLTLSKNSTIKIPFDTAGNLGGLYEGLPNRDRYFRIVNLNDPAFEFRPVYFQVDGAYVDSFQEIFNFVSVNFRKTYSDRPAFTRAVIFNHADLKAGKTMQEIAFPRLGITAENWVECEYQICWSLRSGPTIADQRWTRTSDPAVPLVPPFEKKEIEIEADRQLFRDNGVATAIVEFYTVLAGKPKLQRKVTLRAGDAEATTRVAIYHDRDKPAAYRVYWYSPSGKKQTSLQQLESNYLYLTPPAKDEAGANNGGGK